MKEFDLLKKLVNTHILLFFLLLPGLSEYTLRAQEKQWTLQECIDSAKSLNKNIIVHRNNISLAEERYKEAIANLLPKISFNAEYKYFPNLPYQLMPLSTFGGPPGKFKETQFGVPHNINSNLQLTVPLYNSQIYGAINTTEAASEAAELQFRKTEEQVIFDVTGLFYNAQILAHQLDFIEGNIESTEKLLGNTKLLREQELAKYTDVAKVELQKEQLYTQREIILVNIEQVKNALRLSIGISQDQPLSINAEIQYVNEPDYQQCEVTELKLVGVQNKIIENELSTLKKFWMPSLSFYASYGQTGFGYSEEPKDFLKFFPVSFAGIQLSFPLFNGTITYRKINQKQLEVENSKIQMQQLSEQLNVQRINAENKRKIAVKNIKNSEQQIMLARTVYEQVLIQQREGAASLTDVLLADSAMREAQQSNTAAIIDFLRSDLELRKATGNILNKF
ncbi:MAG: TolC family protein [Ignavibacteriaceae bacterium]|nr:TolC family protein [Ignavibacteriaceae bacterium]